jgi:serine O-acetyltransferase
LPCRPAVIEFIDRAARLVFPGYFTRARVDAVNLGYYLGQEAIALFEVLAEQIALALRHEDRGRGLPGARSEERGQAEALHFLHHLPRIRALLATDVKAAYEGDPAAKSYDEIIFCYPGLFATLVYRLAHQLYRQQVPLLPRIMTEYAHSRTGIDIHPGARIGESFFMDHGTGVVVGETTEIGHRVRLYQGVTLGALSLPKDAVESLRNKKRHPTVEDDVIIYAGATILGGNTVIGARSVIGGNVWLTDSIPPDTRVLIKKPELVYQGNSQARTKAVATGKTKPVERLDKPGPEAARYHAAPEVL